MFRARGWLSCLGRRSVHGVGQRAVLVCYVLPYLNWYLTWATGKDTTASFEYLQGEEVSAEEIER